MENKLKKLVAHLKELHAEELDQARGGDGDGGDGGDGGGDGGGGDNGDSQGCDARDSSSWDRLFSAPADCRDATMPQDNGFDGW